KNHSTRRTCSEREYLRAALLAARSSFKVCGVSLMTAHIVYPRTPVRRVPFEFGSGRLDVFPVRANRERRLLGAGGFRRTNEDLHASDACRPGIVGRRLP